MSTLVVLTKEQLKHKLDQHLLYMNSGSPLWKWHQQKYQETVRQFNRILAREAK